jgi:hypothetical protein
MGIVNRFQNAAATNALKFELDGTSSTFEYEHGLGRPVYVLFQNLQGQRQTVAVSYSDDLNTVIVTSVIPLLGTLVLV